MPNKKICAKEWKQMNYKSMEDCMNYGKPKTQKAGTSAKKELDRVGWDLAEAKNKGKKLKKQSGY